MRAYACISITTGPPFPSSFLSRFLHRADNGGKPCFRFYDPQVVFPRWENPCDFSLCLPTLDYSLHKRVLNRQVRNIVLPKVQIATCSNGDYLEVCYRHSWPFNLLRVTRGEEMAILRVTTSTHLCETVRDCARLCETGDKITICYLNWN